MRRLINSWDEKGETLFFFFVLSLTLLTCFWQINPIQPRPLHLIIHAGSKSLSVMAGTKLSQIWGDSGMDLDSPLKRERFQPHQSCKSTFMCKSLFIAAHLNQTHWVWLRLFKIWFIFNVLKINPLRLSEEKHVKVRDERLCIWLPEHVWDFKCNL